MKISAPLTEIKYWRTKQFFNVGLASYTLSHHNFPRHFHEHYVIELVVKGADKFYCNGKTYTATPGELVFINPGEVHTGSTVSDTPLHYYSISPDRNELLQIASLLERSLPQDICFQHTLSLQSELAHKISLLFHGIQSSHTESLQCEELFLDFMNTLIDVTSASNNDFKTSAKDLRIQQLIDFIHASFIEPLSLQQMAEQVRISPFHLIRLFRTATGLSPYEYMLILRTEHAKQLLQKGYSVQDAAWEAGFYDTSHFNRMFKKMSGTTPKVFRSSK
ncbi:MAG TPA: AraC family transcriptional regulator [Chitinophagaceae bacterium]|jgi:AraC-like DNA-binding protein/mannose-6-phosphate isomerase-like protein (cupin superfamily)